METLCFFDVLQKSSWLYTLEGEMSNNNFRLMTELEGKDCTCYP
jgi:hypothetical protein